jgi:acetyl esterase/lipase
VFGGLLLLGGLADDSTLSINRDDGLLYAIRLARAGVRVRYTNCPGMPHGFLSMPRICSADPQAVAEIALSVLSHL